MINKTYDDKKTEVHKVLKSIYDMALYTDQNMGKSDYMIESLPPYVTEEVVNGIIVLKTVYDSPLKEPKLYIRLNGIKACFIYGEWHNVKYRDCQLYIQKDLDYTGSEHATISDILRLLNEFINTNHYYVKAKSDESKMYDSSEQLINIGNIDLLDGKYVKTLNISGVRITNADITNISTSFKSLVSLHTNSCFIGDDVRLNVLPIRYYHDHSSTFDSLKVFDYTDASVSLCKSTFSNPLSSTLHIDSNELMFDYVTIDYKVFFLMAVADKLEKLSIKNEMPLTDNDIKFIIKFYSLKMLDIYAEVSNYDFLYKLDKLEEVSDKLFITDEKELEKMRLLREQTLEKWRTTNPEYFEKEFNLKHYLMYQRAVVENKYQSFYRTIRVPRIALVKWLGMLNKEDKDIRELLIKINSLSSSARKSIGIEEDCDLILKSDNKYLELLGFETSAKKEGTLGLYHTNILGVDGNPLLRELELRDLSYRKPIIGANGNLLCEINYRPERTINISKHIKEFVREEREDNDPNLTKYYEKYSKHEDKLKYLSDRLFSIFSNIDIPDSLKKKYITILNKYIHEQKALELFEDFNSIFIRRYFDVLIGTDIMDEIKDSKRVDSIVSSLCEEYEIDEEDKKYLLKDFHKMSHYMEVKIRIEEKGIKLNEVVESYFKDLKVTITNDIDKDNINEYMLSDIESLCNRYNLPENLFELFKYYVLYLQEDFNNLLDKELSKVGNIIFGLEETVGGLYGWEPFIEILEAEGIEGLLKKGMISESDYQALCELETARDKEAKLLLRKENIDYKRIAFLYDHLEEIKSLSLHDVLAIKESIPLVRDFYYDKNALYMDQIIRYLTNDYPEWVKRDIEKLPSSKAICVDTVSVKRTYVEAKSIKIKKRNATTTPYSPF